MTEQNQKNELEDLSRSWHERLKNLRLAMTKNQEGYTRSAPKWPNPAQIPSDGELFAGHVSEELPAEQIFKGNKDFYNSSENTRNVSVYPMPFDVKLKDVQQQFTIQPRYKRVQIILAAAIILISVLLLYELLVPVTISTSDIKERIAFSDKKVSQSYPEAAQASHTVPHQTAEQQPVPVSEQPISLKTAQTFYLEDNYSQALDVYQKLYENLLTTSKEGLMRDFLQLQRALCMERIADYNQAAIQFRKVLNSDSPAIRVVAFYHCGLLEMQKKEYLNARTKAYQAIALIDAIDFDKSWSMSLKRNCYFLAAQALTSEVLAICDADKDLPKDLWSAFEAADNLFVNLDETKLREFLNSGTQSLKVAALGPQIQKFDNQGGVNVYNVTSCGASVEELMARFTANAAIDPNWNLSADQTPVRKQLIYLYLLSATSQQFLTVAAGSAGLLAQIDGNDSLNIYNPAVYSRISEYLPILNYEAISLWQEFTLRFPEDTRLANIHFALGLLYTSEKQFTESTAEYKLVANRFSRSSLAPYALLYSSKIKNSLCDYIGGYDDLKQLVEQFPDSEIAVSSYLYYADTAGKANKLEDSLKLYAKVYNLGLSSESQITAVLGAGKSSYSLEDYKSAEKWLLTYTNLAAGKPSKNLYLSYLYLGKTYLALKKTDSACSAFHYALLGVPSYLPKEEYIETIPQLVDVYVQQGNFVKALDLLQNIDTPALTLKESVDILLLKSRVLSAMGLIDRALSVLGDRAEYISDPQLKAQIYYQQSEYYINKGDLEQADKLLTEILVLAKPGYLMHEASLKLADVCLKLGRTSQAVSVCEQLLDLQPSDQIKQKALEFLASAYNQKENYDKAALALLGQWK